MSASTSDGMLLYRAKVETVLPEWLLANSALSLSLSLAFCSSPTKDRFFFGAFRPVAVVRCL